MMKAFILVKILLLAASVTTHAKPANDSLLTGTWKGTSICQVKNSRCHDEIAAYHVSKGEQPGMYKMVMNKIVNGAEEEMGTLQYRYDPLSGILACYDEKYKTTWTFRVTGDTMEGTLHADGVLYRVIKLRKEK